MRLLDADIQDCRALVIDGNATSRSTLVGMLRDFGLGTVVQCSRASDARRQLEEREFDLILCEQHFDHDHASYNGQDLLDELRRAQLLPFSTVFIMVTGEASYTKVSEAAESALDSYLLKPHNAERLAERVREARRRKKTLKPIFDAIEAGQHGRAAALCLDRYGRRDEYWLYAARIGAELLLRIGQHEAARKLLVSVRETRALPWAKLGLARAELAAGAVQQARGILQELIAENPAYADAYDVLGRVQLDQGELESALDTYRRAVEMTPANIARLQKLGTLAFYAGDPAEALRLLDRALLTGSTSKTFDLQTLVLLALLRHDQADSRALQRVADTLDHAVERLQRQLLRRPRAELAPQAQLTQAPADAEADALMRRHQRLQSVVQALLADLQRDTEGLNRQLLGLGGALRDENFDLESALNLVAMLARLAAAGRPHPQQAQWLEALGRRFCISKACTELLQGAARPHATCQALIQQAQAHVHAVAERAMAHSAKGAPALAAETLLRQGSDTLNARLLELARRVLERYRDRLDMHAEMQARLQDLQQRFAQTGIRLELGEPGREAGALALRA